MCGVTRPDSDCCILKMCGVTRPDSESVICIFMELADGGSVHKLLKETRNKGDQMNYCTVKKYMRQTTDALRYLHENEFIHGDLQPSKMLLHQDSVKVCDFALCEDTPSDKAMEPLKKESVGTEADVWS